MLITAICQLYKLHICYSVVECDTPSELANGFFEGKVFSYGNNIVYGCNSGYHLIGSNTYVCDANGGWNITALPECEREIVYNYCRSISLSLAL